MKELSSLKRANEINAELQEAKTQLTKWKMVISFTVNPEIQSVFESNSGYNMVRGKHLNFDFCKMISIKGYTDEIAKLEKEFSELP